MPLKNNPNLEIAIINRLVNLILSKGWIDYNDNFSNNLSDLIIKANPQSEADLKKILKSFKSPFFRLNNVSISNFIKIFPFHDILRFFGKYVQIEPLTFIDIFPETKSVSIDEGRKNIKSLVRLPELIIQETLVDALREKNASNCRTRKKDTVLEVADLEHFSLKINGAFRTFTVVVKGYNSVNRATVNWQSIAHQVTKAYRTNPDHILIVLAKDFTDFVTSELVKYSKDVGNENLIVTAEPITLVRFLKSRNVILK